ncbi:MAG: alanine--tRNA ligase [Labilithrix sp.]|nr:alanine--tRNA ligase [Labilithrix sp.]MCW5812424.1 alanine--tRNA ligase [Labilithrix sp.]
MSKVASEVRSSFLDYFKRQGHEVVASSSLVPQNDPTLMFANAGMVQFKDVFTGQDRRPYTRATSSQKCIRISGKHNDLENVGVTARHHTFFEMLGNFSFGDYFKEDAIAFSWELVTKEWGISPNKLVATVFGGAEGVPADDEARAIWKKVTGWGDDRVLGIPGVPGDNFWQMGETGPCGPSTELHFFTGDGETNIASFGEEPTPDGKGWMEIWNLVFMQFDRAGSEAAGYTLAPLPKPCVDTGAGLERVTSVLQGKTSNYETDLLRALVDKAAVIAKKPYGGTQADDDVSMRVIADHARLTAFLIAEGIQPDRAGRPYVLRRVMRRAIRHGHRLGIKEPFLHEVALEVVSTMGDQYPELRERQALIASVAEQEEVRFRETIDRGLKILDDEVARLTSAGQSTIPGKVVFDLEATYGFPNDLTDVIARERRVHIDYAGYKDELEKHKKLSEGSKVGDEAVGDVWRHAQQALRDAAGGSDSAAVKFTGYEREEGEGRVLFLAHGAERATTATKHAKQGEKVAVVVDETPFYGESGGQVGDRGVIKTKSGGKVRVDDTLKPLTGLVVHVGEVVLGEILEGDAVKLEVDHAARTATRRNHSATHLLHWALRKVVGESAQQKGSLVAPDRLRFDYSSGKPLTAEQIQQIEDLVNEKILLDAPVLTEVLPQAEAKKRGAMAIFEEKYGDVVRVLTMTKDSVELCGGTHARALGEIGMFKILSDNGIAAGVRRVEAATGLNALKYVRDLEGTMRQAASLVKAAPSELPEKIERLLADAKKLDKELAEAKRKAAMGGGGNGGAGGGLDTWVQSARTTSFGKVLSLKLDVPDNAMLREVAEKLRDKLGESVVLVGSVAGPKAMLVLTVSKALTQQFKAGDLIRPIAQILGGSGGGRPDMAQAGGTEVGKIDEALGKLYELVGAAG